MTSNPSYRGPCSTWKPYHQILGSENQYTEEEKNQIPFKNSGHRNEYDLPISLEASIVKTELQNHPIQYKKRP